MPFHIHLEEQPKEIEDCMRHMGTNLSPCDVLLSKLKPGNLFSAVHATYTSVNNARQLASNGVNIVICPCTEGYLGDGIPHVGKQLDFVSFDLCSPVLYGLSADSLVDGIIFGAGNREIKRVAVAGNVQYEQ
uniref:Amidohydro-rel domain-containing protein n=1 Tax=Heterorhabditis bacteriophora TaxID=37862 RepID=A0A1I7X789_HETBA